MLALLHVYTNLAAYAPLRCTSLQAYKGMFVLTPLIHFCSKSKICTHLLTKLRFVRDAVQSGAL